MIEAYEVGVSLVMNEAILTSIARVNSKLGDTQQLIMGANAALKRLNSLTQNATGSANALAGAWKNVAASASAAAGAAARMNGMATGGYYASGDGSARRGGVPGPFTPAGLITYEPPPLPVDANKLPAVVPGQPYYSGDKGGATFKRSGYGTNWTPGTIDGGGDSGGKDAPFNERPELRINPKSKGSHGIGGEPFMDGMVGLAGAHLIGSVFNAGGRMDAIESYMKAAGWSAQDIAAAAQQADYVRKTVKGTNLQQNMEEIYELGSIFKNTKEAIEYLPLLMKQSIVANIPTGDNSPDVYNEVYQMAFQMAQSTELAGQLIDPKTHLIDPKRLAAYATDIADLSLATAGRVSTQDFVDLAKNAGAGVMSQLTPQALVELTPLLLSLGGARTGTALNALAMQFKGGKMSQASARALHDVGLLPDYMFDKHDHILKKYKYGIGVVEIPPNALPGQALYNKDVAAWLQTVIIPALVAHGLTTTAEQENYLYKIGSRIPGIRALIELVANAPQIAKYQESANAINNSDTYPDVANNPILQAQALSASWQAFMTVSGQTWMPDAIKMIDGMTDFMDAAGQFAKNHPTINNVALWSAVALTAGAFANLAMWAVKAGTMPYIAAIKVLGKLNATTDTLVAGSGEIGVAAAGIASVVGGLAEVGAVAWGAYEALDWMNGELAHLFNVPKTPTLKAAFGMPPTPPLIGNAENWVDKKIDGFMGWQYKPSWTPTDWPYSSLVPNAAHPPSASSPQPVYVVGGNASVHVTNPRDIHNAVAKSFTQQLLGIQTGPTGHDSSFGLPLVSGH